MMDSIIFLVGLSLLIIVIGIGWLMVRRYIPHISRIDEELGTIKVMLSEMPKEINLQEYMFTQDQRLRGLGEKLDKNTNPDLIQQYSLEHTQLLNTIIAMLAEGSHSAITRADCENLLRVTNESLGKVLWSLRFDEDRYAESTMATEANPADSGDAKISHINKQWEKDEVDRDGARSMKVLLNNSDDSYGAMLMYMQQTGKSGSDALQALDAVGRAS